MYTSRSVGSLTLLLASQVRTDLSNIMFARDKQTGGNAIQHYTVLTVELKRAGDGEWPTGREDMPPNSFVTRAIIRKCKIMHRYRGNEIKLYFKEGRFDHRFNVLAISKDLELHDGRSYKEFKAKGFNDFCNRIPEELVKELEEALPAAFNSSVNEVKEEE